MNTTIDFRELADRAPLRRLIEEDRGAPSRSRRYLCPFHDDHNPDLSVDDGSNRWKCWVCNRSGDAIEWLVEHRKLTKIEAAVYLGADMGEKAPRNPARRSGGEGVADRPPEPARLPKGPPAWSDPAWQAAVDDIVIRAESGPRANFGSRPRVARRWAGSDGGG